MYASSDTDHFIMSHLFAVYEMYTSKLKGIMKQVSNEKNMADRAG